MFTHKELKARALERADVKAEYDRLDEEFRFFDEFLKEKYFINRNIIRFSAGG